MANDERSLAELDHIRAHWGECEHCSYKSTDDEDLRRHKEERYRAIHDRGERDRLHDHYHDWRAPGALPGDGSVVNLFHPKEGEVCVWCHAEWRDGRIVAPEEA